MPQDLGSRGKVEFYKSSVIHKDVGLSESKGKTSISGKDP